MAGPTPEQLQAVNALLQNSLQQLEAQNAVLQQQAFPVNVQSANLAVNIDALTRALTLDGSATLSAALDQIIVKSAAGNVVLQVQQAQAQELLNLLPSRVTLQLRPGPDGLQATLLVGNRAIIPDKVVDSAALAFTANQTLAPQVPKINQINQATILPSSLFSTHTPEEFLAQLGAQVGGKSLPPNPQQNSAQNFVSNILQKLGFGQPTAVQTAQAVTPALIGQAVASPRGGASSALLDNTSIKIIGIGPNPNAGAEDDGAQIAIVRGNTPSGQPVISVGDKFIAVQGAKNWPVGMELRVLMGGGAGFVTEHGPNEALTFSALRTALETLATLSPGLYNDVARLRMPQSSPSQMPGALLFLFAALQKGAPSWLSDDFTQKLKEMGKDDLLRVLTEQWRAQTNQEADGPGGQWRGIMIPVFDQQHMNALKFYVYDPPDQRGKSKRDPNLARRFLIDFNLTRLGSIQLDGLVHKKRLDLVVRTSRPFESELRNELISHFTRTLEEVRYAGNLSFAANKLGWVEIHDKTGAAPVTQRI